MLNAIYTMCYKDVLEVCPTLLDQIVWDTPEHTEKLKEMLYSKYFNYEISGETIGEEKLFLTEKFNEYKDYYAEMLGAYETSIEWLDGEITSYSEESSFSEDGSETTSDDSSLTHGHTETDSGTDTNKVEREITETTTIQRTEEVTTTRYDLPRSSSSENHATQIVKEHPDGEPNTTTVAPSDGTDTSSLEYGKVKTHGGKDSTERDIEKTTGKSGESSKSHTAKVADLINQKERYLKLIRNLYSEFADKFKPCFITMFS